MNYQEITRELRSIIDKEKGKVYAAFETRVGDMAQDCLSFIEQNFCLTPANSPFEWIDVETRLPDPNEWVLVAFKFIPNDTYEVPIIAQLLGDTLYSRESGHMPKELFKAIKITHWSSLPANPEVRK